MYSTGVFNWCVLQVHSNVGSDVNAVTWGVFPGKEVVQPTVVDPHSFSVWKVSTHLSCCDGDMLAGQHLLTLALAKNAACTCSLVALSTQCTPHVLAA